MAQLSVTQLEIRSGLDATGQASFTFDRSGRRASEERRRWDAARLRKEGWSYRRISAALGVSYATVSQWLDGWEAHMPPPREEGVPSDFVPRPPRVAVKAPVEMPRPRPRLTVSREGALAEALGQNSRILRKLDEMTEALARQQAEARDREIRLLQAIEQQHRQLMAHISASIVTSVQKLLDQHLREVREATAAE